MKPAAQIAEDTWDRVGHSWTYKTRLGEETLTDLLALDFRRFLADRKTRLFQTTKAAESTQGTDLEVRIRVGSHQAILVAIQAKKLFPSGRYESLNTKVKSLNLSQIDVLEGYARSVLAIPLYLLYNNVDSGSAQKAWHCCQNLDPKQLGCTLVPSWRIRKAIRLWGKRTFNSIHRSSDVLPWRCLFECPRGAQNRFLDTMRNELRASRRPSWQFAYGHQYEWLEDIGPVEGAWPKWLWSRSDNMLSSEDLQELRGHAFTAPKALTDSDLIAEARLGPRRLLLVDR